MKNKIESLLGRTVFVSVHNPKRNAIGEFSGILTLKGLNYTLQNCKHINSMGVVTPLGIVFTFDPNNVTLVTGYKINVNVP